MAACGFAEPTSKDAASGEIRDSTANPANTANPASSVDTQITRNADPTAATDSETDNTTVPEKTLPAENGEHTAEMLLQSANVDLDGDGENEQVEAFQLSLDAAQQGTSEKLEGKLRIRDGTNEKQITFCKKDDDLTNLLTSMQFEDLDNDGAKDVFIIIPGNGASFSYSNYFIFSYKKDIDYSFTNDINLTDFIANFRFKYSRDNLLSVINERFNFTADLSIEFEDGNIPLKEYMLDYESRAWIDPVSIDISETSRLALITGEGNSHEIKLPLPVFGMATVDMIGEIDLFYSVDSIFHPVLKRFEVYDFNGSDKIKTGSCVCN